MTYTYALLEVTETAYTEIKAKLLAADYKHAINDDGELDMHGIALTCSVVSNESEKTALADTVE